MFSKPSQTVYTVSRLNREIRTVLEQGFASLVLTGEISNFIAPASGHWYFSLKDDKAQIKELNEVLNDDLILDIGPKTISKIKNIIETSETIL